ncbi:MAG TPA: sigma-70 family RNA polymerase sigma factor [Ktedonosporobacter sp.]|nr:sigma-70 family RNA polymerase sigma factor [Ktedonosporobacter sp.]
MDASVEDNLARLAEDVDRYYEMLVSLYWHQLRLFAVRRLGNTQDAEDVVQEAFMRAYIALENYPLEQRRNLKARAWLYKITWHLICNNINRSKTALLESLDTSEESTLLEREDERNEGPEDLFERAERRQEIEALVSSLPDRYRTVVSLYYFEDLSSQEVADILNQPVGTVKVYVHRGVKLLRKALAMQSTL